MMNITDLINNLSEESIIAMGLFGIAISFYVLRLVASLKFRINTYEEMDQSGRKATEQDLMTMNGIIDELRFEFKDAHDNIEEELVEHELISLAMTPQFKKLGLNVANALDKQSDSVIDLERNISNIANSISSLNFGSSDSGLPEVNNMIPLLIGKLRGVNDNLKIQSSFVHEMQRDLDLIKRACGVE